MNEWICARCGNEYPDDEAELSPDRISMIILIVIGVVGILGGIGLAIAYFFLQDYKLIVYGPLISLMGIAAIGYGRKCGKGVRTKCPSCGKPAGIRLDNKDGKYIRTQFEKKKR